MIQRLVRTVLFASVGLLVGGCGEHVSLAAVFSDHAVLQQGRPIPVWGTAEPGRRVVVRFAGQAKGAVAGAEGAWKLWLDPVAAGGPYRLTASVGLTAVRRSDILVGEVWVCSGQSNMAWPVSRADDAPREVADASWPQIRLFTVPRGLADEPQSEVDGRWSPCTLEAALSFSAVGYFFGRWLHQELKVPIGLIHASWGGSRAESWTPRRGLEFDPDFAATLAEWDARHETARLDVAARLTVYEETLMKYRQELPRSLEKLAEKDEGTRGQWQKPDLDTSDWKTMRLPTVWEQAGLSDFDGVVWFRREVELPKKWARRELRLELGPIDDDDVTFFNGVQVGATGYSREDPPRAVRKYQVPRGLVQAGRNVIAVRVLDGGGSGGICGAPGLMRLIRPGWRAEQAIRLAGTWQYKVGCDAKGLPIPPMSRRPPGARNVGFMYNGMIAPLVPYGIAGVIWYQGESNSSRAAEYRTLFPALIRAWRAKWAQGDFAFLFVQLANFMAAPAQPEDGGWAWIRQAQAEALKLPRTGMAVTIDIGEAGDIHPRNKQEVGRRLALAALATQYGRQLVYSGPTYDAMTIEGRNARVCFRHVGGGLVAKGGELRHFAVSGEDRAWAWAKARIEPPAGEAAADTVVVWSQTVKQPVAVRYAWASNPEGCNLYNKEGLPAAPFRTDDWPPAPPPKKQ